MMSDKIIEFIYDDGSQKGRKQLQILNFIHHKGFNYDQENLNISIWNWEFVCLNKYCRMHTFTNTSQKWTHNGKLSIYIGR